MKRSIITTVVLFITFQAFTQTKHLTAEQNHSTIGFAIGIASGITKVRGKFMEFDLELAFVDQNWTKSKVKFTIQAASINTGIEGRDEHLQSADFFEAETYPEITFTSKQIKKTGEDQYIAIGDFFMHGIAKEMTLPFTVTGVDGNTIGIAIESKINRIDFGVGKDFKHTAIPNFLSDDVTIEINLWTKRDKRKD